MWIFLIFFTHFLAITGSINDMPILRVIPLFLLFKRIILSALHDTVLKHDSVPGSGLGTVGGGCVGFFFFVL